MRRARNRSFWANQSGAITVEFAFAFMIFWMALMGVFEFSRLMLTWGVASEATRVAVRLAAVCDKTPDQQAVIRRRVAALLTAGGQIELGTRTDWLRIAYYPSGCTAENCTFVEAKLTNLHPVMMIPGLTQAATLPDFRISSPREGMRNSIKGELNNVCY